MLLKLLLKKNKNLIGIILLVLGAGLILWGYQLSGSVGSQLTKAISGAHTNKVMMLYIGGAASAVAGLFLLIKK